MQNYLLFRLYGPLAAWGDIAIGEARPSHAHPTKSAIMGLISAALGIRREQEQALLALNQDYEFAVRIDALGEAMQDYHTSQVPGQAALKKAPHVTRRDELLITDLNTVLSMRTYYCDAVYSIVLWKTTQNPSYSLAQIAGALRQPKFTLYLGRKACPLAMPVQTNLIQADSIQAALQQTERAWQQVLAQFKLNQLVKNKRQRLHWDNTGESDIQPQQTFVRQDQLISRKRWQYTDRYENFANYEYQVQE